VSSRRLTTTRLPAGATDVLVVDDDQQLRESALEVLALGGFMATGVANGAEALRQLAVETPGLVLLDLRMPVVDGWTFLRERGASQTLSAIPVVILSGEPQGRTLPPSVAGWITKPFSEEELLRVVAEVLARSPAATAERSSKQ
jgi:two-component system, chemotaxis family, chemotaxis protein CheY